MNQTIQSAKKFFREAHDSIQHKRKYTGAPYWIHTEEVADIVSTVTDDAAVIIAALGHDCIEDVFPVNPFYSLELIRAEFGERVAQFVFDLTDQYTREAYPSFNRKIRKQKERERLGLTAPESQTIKLSDLISNTQDIVVNDPSFAVTYLREKQALLPYLSNGNRDLWCKAVKLANEGCAKLNVRF